MHYLLKCKNWICLYFKYVFLIKGIQTWGTFFLNKSITYTIARKWIDIYQDWNKELKLAIDKWGIDISLHKDVNLILISFKKSVDIIQICIILSSRNVKYQLMQKKKEKKQQHPIHRKHLYLCGFCTKMMSLPEATIALINEYYKRL